MKEIRLKQLAFENFKGLVKKTIEFGHVTTISGVNASGKTRVFDAFLYLLFGKNSRDEEKFQVRPVDADGNVVHNVEITDSGDFEITEDGSTREMTLKKVSKEKWVKRRGSDTTELQGNENSYEIDGYPRSERDYKEAVNDIVEEKVFKILTNPKYFPSMPWKEQRAVLMSLATQQSDADMARSMGGYVDIIDELEKAPSTDDILAKYKKELTEYKKRQGELPVRIDEVSKQRIPEEKIAEYETALDAAKKRDEEIVLVDYSSMAYEERIKKERLESELKLENSKFDNEQSQKMYDAQKELREAEYQHKMLSGEIQSLNNKLESHENNIYTINCELGSLEKELDRLSQAQMDEAKLVCPVCHRRYSAKKIEDLRKDFFSHTNEKMIFVNESIKIRKEELDKEHQEKAKLREQVAQLKNSLIGVELILNKKIPVEELPVREWFVNTDVYKDLTSKIAQADVAIKHYEEEESKQEVLKQEKIAVEGKILDLEHEIKNSVANNSAVAARVDELQKEQREVGANVMRCEKVISLVERFIREKMDLISNQINGKFEGVNWKLFETQINGGVRETCECTIDGVPYASANSGHQIIAGLNIIKTLQEVYGVKAPIFIDNAESVNDFNYPDMDCQMVFLKVSDDKELVVDTTN